tara:strand:+ start:1422 stop:4157 length:2736 start_codon:yes stop_codon:yes gene_type:complete
MSDIHTDIVSLSSAIESGCLILTPNHRSSVQVHESYGELRRANARTAVKRSPAIFPIDIWIPTIFQELLHTDNSLPIYTILDSSQELALWQGIIRDSAFNSPLLNLENAAGSVLEAHRLLIQWKIGLNSLQAYKSTISDSAYLDDCSAFLYWQEQYRHYCKQEKLISFSELLQTILPVLKKNAAILPEKIILLDFNDPPPLYQELFEVLQDNTELQYLSWKRFQPVVDKQSFPDSTAEIKAAASWSKAVLEKNSSARIGIISTDIQSTLPVYKRIFDAAFTAEKEGSNAFFIASATDISKELPLLCEIPSILKFNQEEISTLEACELLRSPLLLASEAEEHARAALEYQLRNHAQIVLRNADLRALLCQSEKPWFSPLLHQALQQAEILRRQQKYKQNLHSWSDFFTQQLTILLWPDDESISKQSLLLTYWQQALADFKKLAFLYPALNFSEALDLLKQVLLKLRSSVYRQEAPVQILNPQDAFGLRFTHLWFLGLTDLQWPDKQYCNPFIPLPLQRKHKLPDSSPELVYTNAQNTLQSFIDNTADQVILSHPRANESNELTVSPLLESIDTTTLTQLIEADSISSQLHPASIQTYLDSNCLEDMELLHEGIHIKVTDASAIRGGINLIANQAECPFKAYAVHRLGAQELPELRYGIPARDLGSMLHKILEHLWSLLKTQQSLNSLQAHELEQVINKAIETGLQYLQKKHTYFMKPAYLKLEKDRLVHLLSKWLNQEQLRSSFEVLEQEYQVEWHYADLKLSFKVDRIDKLENGIAVVDYKSGLVKNPVWDDDRPSYPQLLLYAEALRQEQKYTSVNALLYAQVNIDELLYKGLSRDNVVFPKTGISENRQLAEIYDWYTLGEYWQKSLNSLAREFLDGYLAVKPKSPDSCQYCHLTAFCRIEEVDRLRDD